jgi:hypothetical protein
MTKLEIYVEKLSELNKIKQEVIEDVLANIRVEMNIVEPRYVDANKRMAFIKFSDLKSSWSPSDYLGGDKPKKYVDNLRINLEGSRNIIDTLNKVVEHKNITNQFGKYFKKVEDAHVEHIKNLLGDLYVEPNPNKIRRNISTYISKGKGLKTYY